MSLQVGNKDWQFHQRDFMENHKEFEEILKTACMEEEAFFQIFRHDEKVIDFMREIFAIGFQRGFVKGSETAWTSAIESIKKNLGDKP